MILEFFPEDIWKFENKFYLCVTKENRIHLCFVYEIYTFLTHEPRPQGFFSQKLNIEERSSPRDEVGQISWLSLRNPC